LRSWCAVFVAKYSWRRIRCALFVAPFFLPGCSVFQGGRDTGDTALSDREFVDVYVELARARQPAEKQQILQQHGTTRKEMEAFINAYANDLSALSVVFDSVVARLGMQPGMEVPALPY
jgi:hypothetical protein